MSDQPDLITPDFPRPISLPNASAVLTLGIISIVGSCCFGIVGVICGIISIVLANRDQQLYYNDPGLYSKASYSTSNAGKVCAIIGLCLGSLLLLSILFENISDWM